MTYFKRHLNLACLCTGLIFMLYAFGLVLPKGVGVPGSLLLLIAMVVSIWDYFKHAKQKIPTKAMIMPILVLASFGWAAIFSLIQSDPEYISWSKLDHPSRFLLVGFLFYVLSKRKISLSVVYWALCIGALGCGVSALINFSETHHLNATGAAGHRIMFGSMAAMIGIFILCILPFQSSILSKSLGVIAFSFSILATLLSGSRGAWLGFLASFLVLIMLEKSIFKKQIVFAFFGILVAVFMVDTYWGNGLIKNRVAMIQADIQAHKRGESLIASSVGARIEMWRAAVTIFSDHPILGAGPKTFLPESKTLIEQGRVRDYEHDFEHAHNQYLESLATMGLLGLFALLLLWLGPVIISLKFRRFLKSAKSGSHSKEAKVFANMCILLCVGFMVFGLTEAILSRHLAIIFFLITACMCLSQQNYYRYIFRE